MIRLYTETPPHAPSVKAYVGNYTSATTDTNISADLAELTCITQVVQAELDKEGKQSPQHVQKSRQRRMFLLLHTHTADDGVSAQL